MGGSDLTTDVPGAEVVDDGRPAAANGANGHVAKKRKKQKAMAAVAANGHVGKLAKRKNGAGADHPASNGNGNGKAAAPPAENGAIVTDDRTIELPADEDLEREAAEVDAAARVDEVGYDDELDAVGYDDELDYLDAEVEAPAPPSDARRRAAKRAGSSEPKVRRRAAKRAAAARAATPAGRRAALVATAASIAAAAAEDAPARSSGRLAKYARRFVALVAILMLPAAVYALVTTEGPVTALPQEDAVYLSEQLITADQRVRRQLARLRPLHTSPAIARTRESQLTARSIALELGDHGGSAVDRLQRAVKLEALWLDAVGSVLANPRSPLRDQLVARDAALRPALAALPSTEGLRREGGAEHLRKFAKARIAAKRKRQR